MKQTMEAGQWISYILCSALVITSAIFFGHLASKVWKPSAVSVSRVENGTDSPPVFVIDPGHGGEDGGASSADGVLEKHLNLQISENLTAIARLFGYKTVMTRTEDCMLYDLYQDREDYTGCRKSYDLRNRLRLAESLDGTMFISIHMNNFPEEKYHGLQVYYSPNHDSSRKIASFIQSYTRTFLQAENEREIKKATSAIYLLHRIQQPAVLVECGFLSNTAETKRLLDREYRCQLAGVIFAAAAEWYETDPSM